MGEVYTRDAWNQLIRDVNGVLQNPPAKTSCSPIDPLDEVDEGHVWTKSDIRDVQNKLKQTCADISFDDIPDKWLQSIIDDIKAAKDKAWCHCNPSGGGGSGGGGLPPSPSGHWVIVLCDCASGSIQMTDAEGNCIPFCEGWSVPFGTVSTSCGQVQTGASPSRCAPCTTRTNMIPALTSHFRPTVSSLRKLGRQW